MTDAQDTANKEKTGKQGVTDGQKFDEFVRTILGAFVLALFIRMLAFEPFNIPSGSMIPNLLVGDYLFVSKYAYGYSSLSTVLGLLPFQGRILAQEPKRGDVVVFKLPSDNHTDYIKRVIGLPGDTVQVRGGILFINGQSVTRMALREPLALSHLTPVQGSTDYEETFPEGNKHVIREDGDDKSLDNTGIFIVPKGHYFMMGDNRDNSADSRTSRVSYVPFDNLVGRAEVIFFSMDEASHFWEFWNWPQAVRWDRLFTRIR